MPVRTRKIGVNDKDKTALAFPVDDFRRHWVSGQVGGGRNTDSRVAFNQQDNGFKHLKLTVATLVDANTNEAPDFSNFGPEEEVKYYGMLRNKLSLAKNYILKEKDLSLDPDRFGARHEPAALALSAPPIMIDLYSQHMIRLLLDISAQLRQVSAETPADEVETVLEGPMRDYLEFWERLQNSLSWQLPGDDHEARMGEADRAMNEVLEKLVEP
ncbi:hypothetical protein J4E90_005574 [Alternaria incomplexa]|uniref:uncharacterized protein n=1 Tax=Alternaria incomplexa TaxID=1187928 RepID=UPI00221F5D03|nr:uncharacterized protein J4E90_005574 [Alternaria incomplexa]KAI4913854.1 hypothetical protein J4E90_005574 [Alternaria incomplexa]